MEVPSPKVVINLSWIYENLHRKGESYILVAVVRNILPFKQIDILLLLNKDIIKVWTAITKRISSIKAKQMIKKQQIKSKKDNLLLIGEMAIARTIQTIDRLNEQLCNQNKKTLLFIFLFMYIIPSIIKIFIHIISFSLTNKLI